MLPAIDQAIAGQMTPAQGEEVKPTPPIMPVMGGR